MPREISTSALVLRTRPYGESDRLVTLLTEDHGKLTGIAKGAKNSRRRFAGTLEPFLQVRATFHHRPSSDLVFLHRCELLRPLRRLTQDLDRYVAGSYVIDLADRMVLGRESGADVYRQYTRPRAALLREKHCRIEPSREQHGRRHGDLRYSDGMYLVTKRIDFCYGHRLLDYDGICKHPHGHNAVVEVDVRTDRLDSRNMVADFSDIKRLVKGWIDRELDHKMILRQDDPLVEPLEKLGEPIFKLESNPTVERIAKLIFDQARELGLSVVAVRVWETPSSFAAYTA